MVNNDDHTRLGYDGQVASVLFSRAIGLASSDMQQQIQGGLRGLKTPPLGHEGGVLDPPVSVANITVKEHEGETEISPPPGQVRQPAFIPRRCRIKSHD